MNIKKHYLILKAIISLLLMHHCIFATITINEFQASNKNTLYGAGGYHDWIEIRNSGASAVSLAGYYLSDDANNLSQWLIPGGVSIPANGYLIFYANGANTGYQTNFKLSSFGGQVVLSNPSLTIVDSVSYDVQVTDLSYGRKADGKWGYFKTPTPAAVNNYASYFEKYIEGPIFSIESGLYSSTQSITLSSTIGANIYYTLDGSIPTASSTLYTSPIIISSTKVIKAIAIHSTGSSMVYGCSYVFGASHTLPVIMLTSANDRAEWVAKKIGKANVEGRVNVEYLDENKKKTVNQYAKFEIAGKTSIQKPQLNGRINAAFDKQNFKFNFFLNKKMCESKGFSLKNSSQDNGGAHMRDAFFSMVMGADQLVDGYTYEGYSAAVLYVDGVYDGVIHIMEDDDKNFLENNFPNTGATLERYYYPWADLNKTSSLNFNNPADRTTLENLVSLHDILSSQFFGDYSLSISDFPTIEYVTIPGGVPLKKKFVHDLDFGLFWGNTWTAHHSTIDANILAYVPYKEETAQFTSAFFNFVLDTARTSAIIEQIRNSYKGEMTATAISLKNTNTNYPPSYGSYPPSFNNETEWNDLVDTLKRRMLLRNVGVNNWLKTTFGYTNQIEMTFQTSGASHGNIRVHGIKVLGDNRKGMFFSGVPLNLEAIPQAGYEFSHWEIDASGTNSKFTNTFNSNATVKAVFIPITYTAHQLHINEVQSVNNSTISDEMSEYEDWIEIYNKESFAVDLAGYYVSDDSCNLTKWKIRSGNSAKTTVNAGEWIVFWADNDTTQGANHMAFKFDKSEMFYLTYPNGVTVADSIFFDVAADQSFGSSSDGASSDVIFTTPTPGTSNNITTSVKELYSFYHVFPNPTNNKIQISGVRENETLLIKVYAIDGSLMKSILVQQNQNSIDLSDLSSGIYTFTFDNGESINTQKIVKF